MLNVFFHLAERLVIRRVEEINNSKLPCGLHAISPLDVDEREIITNDARRLVLFLWTDEEELDLEQAEIKMKNTTCMISAVLSEMTSLVLCPASKSEVCVRHELVTKSFRSSD